MGCQTSRTVVYPDNGNNKGRNPNRKKVIVPKNVISPSSEVGRPPYDGPSPKRPRHVPRVGTVVTEDDLVWQEKKKLIPNLATFQEIDNRAIAAPRKLRTKPAELAAYLTEPCKTELERFRAIFRWVAEHMTYDVESLDTGIRASQKMEDVLASGKAVCAGFAGVLEELCRNANISIENVPGCSKGGEYRAGDTERFQISRGTPTKTDHVWNMVKINGQRFLCDVTWAAGNYRWEGGKRQWRTSWNEDYFLADPEGILEDHWPMGDDGLKKQLLKSPTNNFDEWLKRPHKKTSTHTLGVTLTSHKEGTILTNENEVCISFKAKYGLKTSAKLETLKGNTWTQQAKYVLTYREGDVYKIRVRLPQQRTQVYILKILGRLLDADNNLAEKYFFIASYKIVSSSEGAVQAFHSDFCERLGIEADAFKRGFRLDSERPLIEASRGEENISITMQNVDPICLTFHLIRLHDNVVLDDQCYLERNVDKIVCHVRMYQKGEYALILFGDLKQVGNTHLAMLANVLIKCTSPLLRRFSAYPKHYSYSGPEAGFLSLGLKDLNGTSSIKQASDGGVCNLKFDVPYYIPLVLVLYDATGKDIRTNHVCGVLQDGILTALLRLPKPGNYTLGLFRRQAGSNKLVSLAFYMVENHASFNGPLFPVIHDLIGPSPRAKEVGLKPAENMPLYYLKTSKSQHSFKFSAPPRFLNESFAILTWGDDGRYDIRPAIDQVCGGVMMSYQINLPSKGIYVFQIWEQSSPTRKLIALMLDYE